MCKFCLFRLRRGEKRAEIDQKSLRNSTLGEIDDDDCELTQNLIQFSQRKRNKDEEFEVIQMKESIREREKRGRIKTKALKD